MGALREVRLCGKNGVLLEMVTLYVFEFRFVG